MPLHSYVVSNPLTDQVEFEQFCGQLAFKLSQKLTRIKNWKNVTIHQRSLI